MKKTKTKDTKVLSKSASKKKIPKDAVNEVSLEVSELPVPVERREGLQVYLEQIRKHPLLTPEKETELAKKIFDHSDSDAAKLLVLANLRLVVKIAFDYAKSGFNVLDLIQEGNIGLLQAIKEFDPYRGVKFSSYSSYWIKAYIRNFILRNWSLVRLGTTKAQRKLFYQLQKEKNKLEAAGLSTSPKILAERLDVKEKEIEEMTKRLSGRDLSISAPTSQEDDNSNLQLSHLLKDEGALADERLATDEIQKEFTERLNTFERTLSGKELIVFRERLRAEEPKTLQELGDTYGITRERIRQIEARVMEKLKDYMKQNARFKEQIIDVEK